MPIVRTRGPYRKSVKRRREIIEAATTVFGDLGYVGGSLRRIADEAGITEPGLLRQFGSKRSLLLDTLAYWARELELIDLRSKPSGLIRLKILRDRLAIEDPMAAPRRLFAVIAVEAAAPSHPAHEFVQARQARHLRQISTVLREASDAGEIAPVTSSEAEAEARLILGLLKGLELQWLIDPTTDVPALVDTYLETAIDRWGFPLEDRSAS